MSARAQRVQPVDTQLDAGFSTRWLAPYFKTFTNPGQDMVSESLEQGGAVVTGGMPADYSLGKLRQWAGIDPAPSDPGSSAGTSSSSSGGGIAGTVGSWLGMDSVTGAFSKLGHALVWTVVGLLVLAFGLLLLTKAD